jgi:hypothetical protein
MRRRIAENAEMSGVNYYKEEAAKDMALRNDQSKVPQYAEFEVSKPVSPDRLPLNPSQTQLIANSGDRTGSDRSGGTLSTEATSIPGSYNTRVQGLPAGPSPYGGGGYPPAVRMPRPYGAVAPVRMPNPNERVYPPGGNGAGMVGLPPSRSNASLNYMNRPPRANYDVPPPALPPPVMGLDRHASSVYSDYVPPRRQWGAPTAPAESRSLNDEAYSSDPNRGYRPERPTIDTYNLNRNIDNPYVAARRQTPDPEIPVQSVSPTRNRRTSDTGTMIASYYEDVDPRYDDTPPEEDVEPPNAYRPPLPLNPTHRRRPSRDIPDENLPSGPLRRNYSYNSLDGTRNNNNPPNVDDEYRTGPRSPAASTSSHFTSVSQRGINPRWQPQPPPQFIGGPPPANEYPRRQNRPPRNDQMNFLTGNPDFELPVNRAKRPAGGAGGVGTVASPIDAGGRYPLPR